MTGTTGAEGRTFVDTNVLIYAHSDGDTARHPVARAALEQLWRERTGVLSSQILQEFYSAATSKLTPPMRPAEAREVVELYSTWPVVLIEPALILNGSLIAERHQLSIWDALVVEAARVAGARRLWTEDLQSGREIEAVLIENPFADLHGA